MKSIFLSRHAETEANREGKIMGQSDSPLTEKGISDTGKRIEVLSKEDIDIIISSPLGRALATAAMISKELNKPVVIHDGLAELSSGLWEGKYRHEVLPDKVPIRKSWHEKPPGGESFYGCEERVKRVIKLVRSLSMKYKILLVGHGGINQVLLTLWYNLSKERKVLPVQPHNLIYILSDHEVRWIDSSGGKGEGWWKP
jgi:broad specificity phosphatase PhoE